MKKVTLALTLAALAVACGGNADPEPPTPPAGTGAAQAADAAMDADAPDRPMRERMRRGAGAGDGMAGRQGEGGGMGHGEGGGMRHGEGGGMGRAVERPATPEALAEGERLFDAICSPCHSVDPPANLAPPMSHVARHLGRAFDTEEAFREHIRTFVPQPDEDASVMPAHAVERFGLMPALPLPDELLDRISGYVWWLHEVDSAARSR